MKCKYQLTRIQELLHDQGCQVAYDSLRRFVDREGLGPDPRLRLTVRMADYAPREAAERDYARLRMTFDPDGNRQRPA